MKKIAIFLAVALLGITSLINPGAASAVSEPVVDREYLPGFNVYGRYNSVFISSCTRFVPGKSSYTNYFDLAVKNDQGAGYPMKASIRVAVDPIVPSETALKSYTQSTFNNYAMAGNLLSRFVSNDSETVTLTPGANYFVCIDDLANNNATGWFYTSSVPGGYSRMGYPGDVQNTFDGSFGYRTFAYDPSTPSGGDTTGDDTGGGTGTTGSNTTGNSKITKGAGPSSNISKSIVSPTGLTAIYSANTKAVTITWIASTTTTIGGYNVYRTETAGANYVKIGDTGKETVTLDDSDVTAGKSYYYMVRAYKDTAESESSNEASATITTAAVTADQAAPVAALAWYQNQLLWILSGLALILLALLIILIIRRRKMAKKIIQ